MNPLEITRKAWSRVAENASARIAEDQIICSDKDDHKREWILAPGDVVGLRLPACQQVIEYAHEEWVSVPIVIDANGPPHTKGCLGRVESTKMPR